MVTSDTEHKDDIFSVLQVLLKLKDTGTPHEQLAIGHEDLKLPIQPERVTYRQFVLVDVNHSL